MDILKIIDNINILIKKKYTLQLITDKQRMLPKDFYTLEVNDFMTRLNGKSVFFSKNSIIYKIIIEIRNKLGIISEQRNPHIELFDNDILSNLQSKPDEEHKHYRSVTLDFLNAILEKIGLNIFKKKYWKQISNSSPAFVIDIDKNYVNELEFDYIKKNGIHITVFFEKNYIESNRDKIYNVINEVLGKYGYSLSD